MTLPVSDSSPESGCAGFVAVAVVSVAAFCAASNSIRETKPITLTSISLNVVRNTLPCCRFRFFA